MKSIVMKNIGCEPKQYMITVLSREDNMRIDSSERNISEKCRYSRQKQCLHHKQKKLVKTDYLEDFVALLSPDQ